MYIRSQGDMQDFLSRYGLSEQEIKKSGREHQESSAADWGRAAFTMGRIPLLQAHSLFICTSICISLKSKGSRKRVRCDKMEMILEQGIMGNL